jgi:hypothetical protein
LVATMGVRGTVDSAEKDAEAQPNINVKTAAVT